ncbi:MAG: hypothetical protein V4723_03070 [Pseudomonadota bacterium]
MTRINSEFALRAEHATLQGWIAQTEGGLLYQARPIREREQAANARIELATALLRLDRCRNLRPNAAFTAEKKAAVISSGANRSNRAPADHADHRQKSAPFN